MTYLDDPTELSEEEKDTRCRIQIYHSTACAAERIVTLVAGNVILGNFEAARSWQLNVLDNLRLAMKVAALFDKKPTLCLAKEPDAETEA